MTKVFNGLSDPGLIELLKNGAVGVLLTDTVYGLVCLASDEKAVSRLYQLKGRENKPGTLIAANIEQLEQLGIKHRYLKAVEDYWPNPISIILPAPDLNYLHLGKNSLAVRIPKEEAVHKLLLKTGALQTTSANLADQPLAQNIKEAQAFFGDNADFYVDGGDAMGKPESTIIRIVDDAIDVVREGAVKIDDNGRISQ
jgi:L-threonylcarbamoyladenylate synthase